MLKEGKGFINYETPENKENGLNIDQAKQRAPYRLIKEFAISNTKNYCEFVSDLPLVCLTLTRVAIIFS